MKTRTAFRISLAFGIVVLLFAAFALAQYPMKTCGGLPSAYPPVIAFELARTSRDIAAIFGDHFTLCRAGLVLSMAVTNWLDSGLFIPVYTAFLVFFFAGMRSHDARLAKIAMVLAAIAGLADYFENFCLFHIMANFSDMQPWLSILPWATGLKWLGLGVLGALGAVFFAREGGWNYLLAALCTISLIATVAALALPPVFGPYISNGVAISWVVFLFADIRGAFSRAAA